MNKEEGIDGGRLEVITFGNFAVKDCKYNLTDQYNSSLKLWELFKFLITYKDERILPEKIIDSIWPDSDYQDPKRTLRALIFRLRKMLSQHSDHDGKDLIVHSHGCYKLVAEKLHYIDVIDFEESYNEALAKTEKDPAKAIALYHKVISMYKGGYLTESYEQEWLVPARNYYRRIFLQSIIGVSDLLKAEKKYQEMIVICQNVFKYELLEEEIHYIYIEALGELGKVNQAKNHYQYLKDLFERELGIRPSERLSSLYRLISRSFNETKIDTDSILEKLGEDRSPLGAVLCDPDFFKFQYQLERRRYERDGRAIIVGLLTVSHGDFTTPSDKCLKPVMQALKEIILESLRQGDVITQWNKAQFIINLPEPSVKEASSVFRRIKKKFLELENSEKLVLHIRADEVRPLIEKSNIL